LVEPRAGVCKDNPRCRPRRYATKEQPEKSRIVNVSIGKATYIRSHGLVDGSPPDLILRGLLLDNTLVRGGTTSLSARVSTQSTAGGDGSAGLVDKSILIEGRNRRVGNL
jgi:hypothetical protein